MSVLPRFEMEIHDNAAIEGEGADHHVLHLEVLRFESASKNRDDEHDGGEGNRGPIVRKKSPSSACRREPAKIGMDGQKRAIRRASK